MIELKPCPFCGAKPSIIPHKTEFKNNPIIYSVGCLNINCFVNPETLTSHLLEGCVEVWNTRDGDK